MSVKKFDKKNPVSSPEEETENNENPKKKRKKYVTSKSIHLENLLEAAKDYKFGYKPKNIDLVKDKEEVRKLTNGTCLRPDIYLDNDYSCDGCYIFDNCVCSIKKLKKKK